MFGMRRRDFVALLGGAAAWPLAARAQQPAMPVIGFLTSLGRNDRPNLADAFRRGLSEAGLCRRPQRGDRIPFCGKPTRSAAGDGSRFGRPQGSRDRSDRRTPTRFWRPRRRHRQFRSCSRPVAIPVQGGFVTSLNRPGGNVTGISWFGARLSGKALGLLHELVPNAAVFAMMVNPNNPESECIAARRAGVRARCSGGNCLFSMPVPRARSTPPSPPCGSGGPARSSSVPIRSLPPGASKLSRWQRVTPSLLCTSTANSPRMAG